MNILKKILPAIIISSILAGCSSLSTQDENLITKYPEPSFADEAPIQLEVNRINIISEFTPTFTRPNVEHLFPVSIEKTAKRWAGDRLKAVDFATERQAVVIIKDASVTEELEKSDQIFKKDRIKYKANLNVIVQVTDTENLSRAETEVQTWRELIIPADTDIAEKEKYWNAMVEKLFTEFNAKMTKNVNQYLNIYLSSTELTPTYY